MCMRSAISAGALSLLLGTIVPVFSQHDRQEKEKGNPQQGQQQQQARPHKNSAQLKVPAIEKLGVG